MNALTYVLAALAALRATRFVTSDWLGEWLFVGKARAWGARHEERARRAKYDRTPGPKPPYEATALANDPEPRTPQARLVKGLDCPFCVGFWITGAAILLAAAANRGERRRKAFQVIAGAVGANYITGHISSRIDG